MSNISENLDQFEKEILEAPRSSYNVQLKLYDIFIPTLGSIIIILNLIIVFSSGLILKKRQQPRSTYIFLGNIGLADMMTGAVTIFGQYYPKNHRTEMVCCYHIGLIISATLASIYSIALIAIDRYLYILYGMQYQRYLSSKRARLMVLGTWVLGGIVGFLPAMGVRRSTDNGRFCWLIILEPTALILSTVIVGTMPLVLIIILYSIILKRALGKISEMRYSESPTQMPINGKNTQLRYFRGGRKSIRTLQDAADGSETGEVQRISYIQEEPIEDDSLQTSHISFLNCCRKSNKLRISSVYSPSRWRAIKIVVFTTGCFFVTWFPYFFACALYTMCDPNETPQYCNGLRIAIASPLAILGLLNSLLNPIIYAWWHNGFRETAKKIYNDMWRRGIRPKLNAVLGEAELSETTRQQIRQQQSISTSTETSKVLSSDADGSDIEQLTPKTHLGNSGYYGNEKELEESAVVLGLSKEL